MMLFQLTKELTLQRKQYLVTINFVFLMKVLSELLKDMTKKQQIIWASTEEQEKLDIRFSNRFKVLDSLLAKKDIASLLEQIRNLSDWQEKDLNKIHDFKISFNSNSNRISKPIYTLNKKYAIICYDFSYTDKNIIIYKKVNNNWVYVSIIKNIL